MSEIASLRVRQDKQHKHPGIARWKSAEPRLQKKKKKIQLYMTRHQSLLGKWVKVFNILNFLLEYSWFTMLCYFQVYNKVNQLYIYIYPLFLDSFPIQFITEYWVEFPVLYSRSLLVIYVIYSSKYMSIPISQFIPHPLTPW